MDKASIFLDTNILLDILTGRDGSAPSKELHAFCGATDITMFISTPGLATTFYVASRMMDRRVAYDLVARFYLGFEIVEQNKLDVAHAFALPIPDLEDGLQYQASVKSGCRLLVSRDVAFQRLGLTAPEVVSPEVALSRLS